MIFVKYLTHDVQCQSFAAQQGPVVHLADLVWLRGTLFDAWRGPVVHHATSKLFVPKTVDRLLLIRSPKILRDFRFYGFAAEQNDCTIQSTKLY